MIEKWFGKIPKRTRGAARRGRRRSSSSTDARRSKPTSSARAVWIGWALPAGEHARGRGRAVRHLRRVRAASRARREEYGFAYASSRAILGGELAPLFLIQIELKGMDKLDEALEFAQKAAKQAYRGWDEGSLRGARGGEEPREGAASSRSLEPLPSAHRCRSADLVQFSKDFDFNSTDQYLFHAARQDRQVRQRAASRGAVKKALDWDKAAIVVVKPNKKGIKGDTRSKVKFAGDRSGDAAR